MKFLFSSGLHHCSLRFFCFYLLLLGIPLMVHGGTDPIILAFGDSITVGKGENSMSSGSGTRTGGYEPDLEVMLESTGTQYHVLNYGLNGEYTVEHGSKKGGYRRLVENVLPKHPDARFVLIMEGTNDYWAGASRSTTLAMLELMIDSCLARDIEPVIATLTPDHSTQAGYRKNIPAYNDLIIKLADRKEILLVDTYSDMIHEWDTRWAYGEELDKWYVDLTHLSREGYYRLAELWYAQIVDPLTPVIPKLSWIQLLLSQSSGEMDETGKNVSRELK